MPPKENSHRSKTPSLPSPKDKLPSASKPRTESSSSPKRNFPHRSWTSLPTIKHKSSVNISELSTQDSDLISDFCHKKPESLFRTIGSSTMSQLGYILFADKHPNWCKKKLRQEDIDLSECQSLLQDMMSRDLISPRLTLQEPTITGKLLQSARALKTPKSFWRRDIRPIWRLKTQSTQPF